MPGSTFSTPSRWRRTIHLTRMDNVTLTSHAGYRTREASLTLMRRAIDIVRRIVASPSSS